MKKDFVTFELAKKLRDKGFKEKCIAYYWEKINEHTPCFLVEDNIQEDGISILDLISNHNQAEWSHFIDAPTISQVLKWLRDEKKIYIISQPFASMATTDKVVWSWHWKHNSDGEFIDITYSDDTPYISYEEAALAGINYVLDNVI